MESIVNEIRNSIGKQITELRTEPVRGPKAVTENAAQRNLNHMKEDGLNSSRREIPEGRTVNGDEVIVNNIRTCKNGVGSHACYKIAH